MANEDTQEEKDFRERYAEELRKKKIQNFVSPHFGCDELSEEIRRVKQQELITPGRRGEKIKHEEISKEIIRRLQLKHQSQDNKG
jgi:predicted nucleic acid-binding protein